MLVLNIVPLADVGTTPPLHAAVLVHVLFAPLQVMSWALARGTAATAATRTRIAANAAQFSTKPSNDEVPAEGCEEVREDVEELMGSMGEMVRGGDDGAGTGDIECFRPDLRRGKRQRFDFVR